jgi:reactive intermediate/imine deaminase
MSVLTMHSLSLAPDGARKLLQGAKDRFGWVVNQSAYMAESPELLEAYQRAHELFIASSLDETEKAVVWIATGLENRCRYTVGAHCFIAQADGVDNEIISALVDNSDHLPERLLALRKFTRHVIHCHGQVGESALAKFLDAGFTPRNALDVILGVSQKTMSTLLNSIAKPELDAGFVTKWVGQSNGSSKELATATNGTEFLNSGKVLPKNLPFSEAVRVGGMLYLSGQMGIVPGTIKPVDGGIREESRQAMENIKTSLEAHGYGMSDIVKCTVMLADISEWSSFNEVYKTYFNGHYPARSALGANGLALGARVEIECLAAK